KLAILADDRSERLAAHRDLGAVLPGRIVVRTFDQGVARGHDPPGGKRNGRLERVELSVSARCHHARERRDGGYLSHGFSTVQGRTIARRVFMSRTARAQSRGRMRGVPRDGHPITTFAVACPVDGAHRSVPSRRPTYLPRLVRS